MEGWKTETKEIKQLEEFLKNARLFLNTFESLLALRGSKKKDIEISK